MGNYKYSESELAITPVTSCKHRSDGNTSSYQILDLEIDRGCEACAINGFCANTGQPIPLYKYNEIPDYLRGNPYVVGGYRSMLPFSFCVKSLFVMSNETINIWSHLFGFGLFFCLMMWDIFIYLPVMQSSVYDYIITVVGLLCFQFCMLCSAGYHLFMCHSEQASRRWLSLDLTGISIGLLGCYLPAVYYAFFCLTLWRDVYMIIISILFGIVFVFQTNPVYYTDNWFRKRLMLYLCLSAYGIVPSVHWIVLNGGFGSKIVQMFLPKVVIMYVFAIAAFWFYISKFPERCLPGKCDYLGSSHQIWHGIVVVAFYWWHNSGWDLMIYRQHNHCSS